MRGRGWVAGVILASLLWESAAADTVQLTNGRKITDCQVISETPTTVTVRTERATAQAGQLTIRPPAFDKDVACKIRKAKSEERKK